jgi:hypothetical protein
LEPVSRWGVYTNEVGGLLKKGRLNRGDYPSEAAFLFALRCESLDCAFRPSTLGSSPTVMEAYCVDYKPPAVAKLRDSTRSLAVNLQFSANNHNSVIETNPF